MIHSHRVLGVITARVGSKGLPGKNVRELCGKPLIAWSIVPAIKSKCLDKLVVSTDSPEIADIATRYGADVPFLRPAELASDVATSISAVDHAVRELEVRGETFDVIVLLEPTSPLREARDIDSALEQMLVAGADSIVSVCLAESIHPALMFREGPDGRLHAFQQEGITALRRQELEKVFFPEGTVYASRLSALRRHQSFYQPNTVGYVVPKWKSPEIDDIIDFLHVEAIIKHMGIEL